MSPEIALLFRAVLLGVFLLMVEKLSKHHQGRRAREEHTAADRVIVRQPAATPAAPPVLEPEFQYVRAVAARPEHAPLEPQIRSVSARVIERRNVGAHVTKKRSLASSEETYRPVFWLDTIGLDEIGLDEGDARANDTEVNREHNGRSRNPNSYETA